MPNTKLDGLLTWDAPVGYAEDMYWDQSSKPLTVESVSLLDPHNLVLHGGAIYKMPHSRHPLPISWAWADEGREVPAGGWSARQRIPGATIPPVGEPVIVNGAISFKADLYEIVVDISAGTPAGGWALGEVVRYTWDGGTYTFVAKTGLGVGTTNGPGNHSCDAQMRAIAGAFSQGK